MTLFLVFAPAATVARAATTRQPLYAVGFPVRSAAAVAAPVRTTEAHER